MDVKEKVGAGEEEVKVWNGMDDPTAGQPYNYIFYTPEAWLENTIVTSIQSVVSYGQK